MSETRPKYGATETMNIAIDPGNTESAFVAFIGKEIFFKGKVKNSDLKDFIKKEVFGVAVIEMIASYGMAVGKSVFETCLFIGQLQELIGMDKHILIYRKDIKMHLCGSMRAKDSNIRQALIDRYGEPGTKKNQGGTYGISKDVWSALAVMTYYLDTISPLPNN